jgi:cation diffusion facilitator family transporter
MDRTQRAVLITAFLCAFFATGLLLLAAHLRSVALLAGGLLTVSRTITGFLVAVGIGLSQKHTDRFRSGLYKIENLIVAGIGALIMAGAWELGKVAVVQALAHRPFITEPSRAIPTLVIAALFALANAAYKRRVARQEASPSLMADARHSFVDAGALGIVALGVALSAAGIPLADLAAGFIVAVIAAISGGRIALDGIKVLLDASIERDVLNAIRQIISDGPGVREISGISGRNSGSYRFLSLRLVPFTFDVPTNTAISEHIKKSVRERYPNIDRISIEYVPGGSNRKNIAIPLSGDAFCPEGDLFSAEDFVLVDGDIMDRSLGSRRIIRNPHPGHDLRDNIDLAVMLAKEGTDILVYPGSLPDNDAVTTLSAYGIDMVPGKPDDTTPGVEQIALDAIDTWKARLNA